MGMVHDALNLHLEIPFEKDTLKFNINSLSVLYHGIHIMEPEMNVSRHDLVGLLPSLRWSLRNENEPLEYIHYSRRVVWSLSSNSKGFLSSHKRGQFYEVGFFEGKSHKTSFEGQHGHGFEKEGEGGRV